MRTGTLLTDDSIDSPVRTDGSFPSQRAIRGGIPASFRGIGQTFPGTLTGPEKCNTGLRSRTFGSRNPVLQISKKALCLRRTVAALIAVTVTTTPPVPAAAITLATTFSVAGLHIRSRDHTFCRYRPDTLRTVAPMAPTTPPAASVSATARPTASPATATTGKSGGVIFRACTYGFRQGQFRNLPLDKLLDTVEFSLLLLVYEGDGPARSARASRTADAMDVILGIVRHVVIDD